MRGTKKRSAQLKQPKTEIIVRVETTPYIPTVTDLAEPMTADGSKALTIRKSWLSESQLHRMLQRTPREQVYQRKGKGGKDFDYVTGSYCTKWLNFIFAWDWDFEITQHGKENNHVWALGRLTVRGEKPGQSITKTQFGRSDVKQLKAGGNVDYGNDLKAAATDSLKKCASLLGFASDIYGKMDYKEESGRDPLPPADPRPRHEEPVIQIDAPDVMRLCITCEKSITEKEAVYSKKLYGRELCPMHYPKK